MMKLMVEIPIQKCLERCLMEAEKCLEVYDDMDKNFVEFDVVIKAISSKQEGLLIGQYGLKPSTVGHLLTMSLKDLGNNRRPFYENVVKHLKELV